ncbi:hypothetical protein AAFF_G00341130 [Aldrovandia affinis]|uniref:Uncharacterized protein n=1 Tax=Aldrovandia affinis TaxID=143900 RepID=A0AAD7WPL1_9TELE|nr:hypothetical protein AAFF_G00341130 [Aldrovandia affinis]
MGQWRRAVSGSAGAVAPSATTSAETRGHRAAKLEGFHAPPRFQPGDAVCSPPTRPPPARHRANGNHEVIWALDNHPGSSGIEIAHDQRSVFRVSS